jgi:hypothetical protein
MKVDISGEYASLVLRLCIDILGVAVVEENKRRLGCWDEVGSKF